jgi:hypothetical protein
MKMKKMIAIAAGIVVLFASCASTSESTGDSAAFAGTWKGDDHGERIVAAKGSLIWYSTIEEWVSFNIGGKTEETLANSYEMPSLRGSYKVSGNTVTMTFTHFNMREEEEDPDQWVAYAKLSADLKKEIPQTLSVTLSDNSFTTNIGGQNLLFTKGG